MADTPLADPSDVEDVWRPLADDAERARVAALIAKASAKLRKACPFDIDARIELYLTDPGNVQALNPVVVADRVATIVKRFLVNVDGATTTTETVGPYSQSRSYLSPRVTHDDSVRGELRITEKDVDELRPTPAPSLPFTAHIHRGHVRQPVRSIFGWPVGGSG